MQTHQVYLITLLICIFSASQASGQSNSTGSLPRLPVRVNGTAGMFLIDTGAEQSVIDKSFSKNLGLTPTGLASVRENYLVDNDLPVVTAAHFALDGEEFSNAQLVELDLGAMSIAQSVTLDGILGTDFLQLIPVVLSYSSSTAHVTTTLNGAGAPLTLRRSANVFFASVQIGRTEVELLLDSGTNSTAINARTWQALPKIYKSDTLVEGIRSAGTAVTSALSCAPVVRLGGTTFKNQPLRIVPLTRAGNFAESSFNGLLGADLLEHFEVTLDLARSKIYLRPNPSYRANPYAFVTIGIQFFRTKTKDFAVAAVWKNSPAEKAGILVGDLIVSVNGIESKRLNQREFADQLHKAPGTSVALEIIRSGTSLTIRTVTQQLACASLRSL